MLGRLAPMALAALLLFPASCRHVPTTPDVPPVLLNREEIIEALRAVSEDLEAQVLLVVRVDELGRVEGVWIAEGSGDRRLDSWAIWAGKQMRFTPAQYKGRSLPSLVRVPISFDLPPPVTHPPALLNADSVRQIMAREHEQLRGTVRLRVRVAATGEVESIRMVEADDRAVREAAFTLAAQLRFKPARQDRMTVAFWVVAVFEFGGDESRVSIEPPEGESDGEGNL